MFNIAAIAFLTAPSANPDTLRAQFSPSPNHRRIHANASIPASMPPSK
jgi:hypothetical protein